MIGKVGLGCLGRWFGVEDGGSGCWERGDCIGIWVIRGGKYDEECLMES